MRKRIKSGVRSVDVGCMQINLRWHPDAFATIEDGFDPQKNVDYAARLLVSRYRTMGSWIMGAGAYHSFTPDTRDKYIKHLRPKIAQVNRDVEVYRDKVASYQVVETSSTKVPAARRNASKNGSFKWLSPNSGKPSSLWSQE